MSIENLVRKVVDVADKIAFSYYVNNFNFDITSKYLDEEVAQTTDVVIFSIMTGLLNRNQLFLGNYGLGKTTVSQAVSSALYGYPIEFIKATMLNGHPYLTEEKIIGRPHFGKMNHSGEEVAIFSLFAQTPTPKIIDEINRIPEGTQNLLLDSVETGNFSYLNDFINLSKLPFYATANYKDGGNTTLTPPLLDRFDVSVEVAYPLFLGSTIRGDIDFSALDKKTKNELEQLNDKYQKNLLKLMNKESVDHDIVNLQLDYELKKNNILEMSSIGNHRNDFSDSSLSDKLRMLMADTNKNFDDKIKELKIASYEYQQKRTEFVFNDNERKILLALTKTKSMSDGAQLFVNSFFDFMNVELKINGEKNRNHNDKYLIGNVNNNLSVRASMRSVADYSRMLALLKGENSVSVETVQQILPYVINHRINFKNDYNIDSRDKYPGSLQFQRSRQLVDDFMSDFGKCKETYREMYDSLKSMDENVLPEFVKKNQASDNPLIKAVCKINIIN